MTKEITVPCPKENWKPSACMLCSVNCGIQVLEKDGQFLKIRGDKAHGSSQGYLCQKAGQLNHYQNHKGRLTHPLKKQPDGSFDKISWEQAISEIAGKFKSIHKKHGGQAIAYYGGGGQGNHLGGAYSSAFREALDIEYVYTALAQEKTGDFWVNGKLFGRQSCFVSEGMDDADYIIVLGANPWIAHGLPQTRTVLHEIRKNSNRTLVVVDPRVSETAGMADIHLQVKPGRDAFLLSAIIAIIIRDGLTDQAFLQLHTTGYQQVKKVFEKIDIDAYCQHAGIHIEQAEQVAHGFAKAEKATVRADLGIQQSLHSTLNSYLEKLLYLLTGNFNRKGSNFLAPLFAPLIAHSPDPEEGGLTTRVTGARAISKIFPPNVLPLEINNNHSDRIRAVWVDSGNPALTGADTHAYREAFEKLDLLVVVDVAFTETAELADYVLPAPSQFEKAEASFFTFSHDFRGKPTTFFHLRKPVTEAKGNTLPEPEIYRRMCVALGAVPERFPLLEKLARLYLQYPATRVFPLAIAAYFKTSPKMIPYASAILYSTLGKALPKGMETAAIVWAISQFFVQRWPSQVRATGLKGSGLELGYRLFKRFIESPSAAPIASFSHDSDTWKLLRHKDRKVHLAIPELIQQLLALPDELNQEQDNEYPFTLMAGERRSWNANQIYRNPDWRKKDKEGTMRIHPQDAEQLQVQDGSLLFCQSRRARIQVTVQVDDTVQPGMVTLPHGYGMKYQNKSGDWKQNGPAINMLTDSLHADEIAKTPFHKTVPVKLIPN
ncbi:molybdopterin-dependent oxidoreductase [Sansalvadorimonas sp. 2012CJ34-2]|uniref:Molybdopterin-dependent oxidoreductase n=1 Tax=Parendozoicomonas callyspongiae TaxID=2942213 RepID=A0ABT0PKB6_9GAMM|nr:molybdopterin-dependent oxidoreductase [Sansalvadorimonas sp. 2012CJ34-2]MCL6271716.1 molybdopterin-dependent oxidoreductase [Sansalvadorimonas sp. 2012CJ34-2]